MPEQISLLISGSWWFYTIAAILLALLAWYFYRITVPVVSLPKRYFLFALRGSILLVIALLLFSPVLNLAFTSIETPVHYFFVDRSESISFKDGTKREETVTQFLSDLAASPLGKNSKVFSFAKSVDSISANSPNQKLKFDGEVTNFENIFAFAKEKKLKNATISIISDGVMTDGTNPLFSAEKLGIPVFSVMLGDSSAKKDIVVENVVFNDYIFKGSRSPVTATIQVAGFPDTEIKISLTEDGQILDSQVISLDKSGSTSVSFTYTPKSTGIKKLAVTAQNFPGEVNKQNNIFPFFVNVIDNRKKVLVLSGAPTLDVTFIKNALSGDSNLTVRSMTFDASDKPLEKDINNSVFDSTGVLFLLNYPSKTIPGAVSEKVIDLISNKNVPFFILINQYSEPSLLKKLEPWLPVTISPGIGVDFEAQPGIAQGVERNPLFYTSDPAALKDWDALPPVLIPNLRVDARPESQVLAYVKLNNKLLPNPLIVSRNFGFKRSIAIIAGDVWKWKLKAKKEKLFDDFLFSSAKWLGAAKDKKRFSVRTNKKFYSRNEQVEFIAEAYTESFDPLSDADVKVALNSSKGKSEFNLSPVGFGIYQGIFKPETAGDYTFAGTGVLAGTQFGSDQGTFNVGDVNIELVDPYSNPGFLRDLSSLTDGTFYTYPNYLKLFDELERKNKESATSVKETQTHNLWNNPWLLVLLVSLFSLEWFLRKREGMM
ncbi:hypothetical protein MASR1M107_15530 [Ignavibacteriales bacterium]